MANVLNLLEFVLSSPRETDVFGHAIGKVLRKGDVLALVGELGAGKTALVRGIVTGLGGPVDSVTSPTFMLVHEYQGRLPLMHLDLYRLQRASEVESIGLSSCFTDETVTAIEWADLFPHFLPADRLEIRLIHRSPRSRIVRLQAGGTRSRSLLMRIRRACHTRKRSAPSPPSGTRAGRKVSRQ